MIHNLMTIEITMKKKKPDILTKNLRDYQYKKKYKKLDVTKDAMMDFDGDSNYLSAMWDENSVYPKKESGFVFTPHMNDVYVIAFNDQTYNEDGNESAILKIKYYSPLNLIFHHLPVKEKVEK